MSNPPKVMFQIRGQDPLEADPALYSNFVAISRVGTDVQFEFVFLDLNYVANLIESKKAKGNATDPDSEQESVTGKTVAKIVMPAASFIQIKEHVEKLFGVIEEILAKKQEGIDERRTGSTSG